MQMGKTMEVMTMSFDNAALSELEKILDDRYVRQKDCDKTVEKEEDRITKLEIRFGHLGFMDDVRN